MKVVANMGLLAIVMVFTHACADQASPSSSSLDPASSVANEESQEIQATEDYEDSLEEDDLWLQPPPQPYTLETLEILYTGEPLAEDDEGAWADFHGRVVLNAPFAQSDFLGRHPVTIGRAPQRSTSHWPEFDSSSEAALLSDENCGAATLPDPAMLCPPPVSSARCEAALAAVADATTACFEFDGNASRLHIVTHTEDNWSDWQPLAFMDHAPAWIGPPLSDLWWFDQGQLCHARSVSEDDIVNDFLCFHSDDANALLQQLHRQVNEALRARHLRAASGFATFLESHFEPPDTPWLALGIRVPDMRGPLPDWYPFPRRRVVSVVFSARQDTRTRVLSEGHGDDGACLEETLEVNWHPTEGFWTRPGARMHLESGVVDLGPDAALRRAQSRSTDVYRTGGGP